MVKKEKILPNIEGLNPILLPQVPVGGRLSLFFDKWQKLTDDFEILNMVTRMSLEFDKTVISNSKSRQLPLTQSEHEAAKLEIRELLWKNAIAPCEHEFPEYVSNIFVVPKKNSLKMRVILNLKKFNFFLEKRKFKMQTLTSMLNLVSRNSWLSSIDLADAYLVIKILSEHTRYLKFEFDSVFYKYLVMCFGMSSAPRKYTKLLKAPLAKLHSDGHVVSFYFDDSLQVGKTYHDCLSTVVAMHNLLVSLGFLPNFEKSQYFPTQRLTLLGFVIDTVNMTVSLTDEKINKLREMFSHTLANPCMPIRSLARITGKMISCFLAMPKGRLYYRPLERRKVAALTETKNYDGKVLLLESELFCVRWWLQNLKFSTAPIRRDNPSITLFSDASSYGYGGFCKGEYCQGFFSERQLPFSINSKETLAVWYSILSFRSKLINKHCLVLSDNKMTISYVSHMRGMQSELRDKICRDIWNFIFDNNMWLYISFIPGKQNLDADFASCQLNPTTEMAVPEEVFHSVCMELNFYLSVDMMASRTNNKCKNYFSFCPDPFCLGVNAFYANWNHDKMYIFSPISLNSR